MLRHQTRVLDPNQAGMLDPRQAGLLLPRQAGLLGRELVLLARHPVEQCQLVVPEHWTKHYNLKKGGDFLRKSGANKPSKLSLVEDSKRMLAGKNP